MSIAPFDAWITARLLSGQPVADADLAAASDPIRPLAARLAAEPDPDRRQTLAEGYALGLSKPVDFLGAIALAPRDGPAPTVGANQPPRTATLADVRRIIADTPWPWPGWMAVALNSLAADPGIGKTILAMSLAAILWHRRPWPDGQSNTLPKETRTLWVPGDSHYAQLIDLATKFGLPYDAVLLNSTGDSPTDGLDLDDTAELDALGKRIKTEAPGLVIVDTVGMVTSRNLCRPEDAREFFGPLMRIVNDTGTPFLLLTHLSRDSQALGRRIVGASRVVWKLTHPDPDGQPDRRRLSVDKSYMLKPPPLGMAIADSGCTFDFNPPAEPEPRRTGPVPARLEECRRWLADRLAANPDSVKDVRTDAEQAGFSADLLYRSHEALGVEEYTIERRKWWRLPSV